MLLKVLGVSDRVVEIIYSPSVRERFGNVDMIISCGDLPHYYVEFILSALDKPAFFVRGNHAYTLEYSDSGTRHAPEGATDLHRKVIDCGGVLLAGVEGSVRYKPGPFQYTQRQMWRNVLRLVPGLLLNRARYGRYLDIFVTHAAPWRVNDLDDWPHQGIRAFRWLVETFQPAYHLHGHIHLYTPKTVGEGSLGRTQVINVYGFRNLVLDLPGPGAKTK